MRVDNAGAEFDELSVEGVVHMRRIALKVRSCTFDDTLLLEEVKGYIIGVVRTATREVDIVVLTDTGLEDLVEPVGIGIVHEVVLAIFTELVATGHRCTAVGAGLPKY